ncbi:unnamed protein product (macronuclear) [Paramecium tetraurelia]|uniref:Uncharacterized protein n=1 Tax=Paramecium tetraurelia TaxID=5888 RepID=A0BM80_PARTE|nr:uncharacterized protein GSPATT00030281001 [Paramecium tetraurelia]CAK59647.1 unnamed protein product [Paramecium tetraurelia]|eukprot:XP_001427045.1 hypothetical protein (macronuclear) [Paramecium tetraurelia strain d4-2]
MASKLSYISRNLHHLIEKYSSIPQKLIEYSIFKSVYCPSKAAFPEIYLEFFNLNLQDWKMELGISMINYDDDKSSNVQIAACLNNLCQVC